MTADVGDCIELEFTSDEYTNLRPGDRGTVTYVDALGTVSAKWDNGSTLGLVPGVDRFHVVNDAAVGRG